MTCIHVGRVGSALRWVGVSLLGRRAHPSPPQHFSGCASRMDGKGLHSYLWRFWNSIVGCLTYLGYCVYCGYQCRRVACGLCIECSYILIYVTCTLHLEPMYV